MAGLAYAIARFGASPRHLVMGLLGGLVGAVLGTLVYDIIGAVVLTMHSTQNPFATDQPEETSAHLTRLLSLACVAAGTALGTVFATRGGGEVVATNTYDPKASPTHPA